VSTRFTLNGTLVELVSPPMTRLLDALREEAGFTGSKEGCGEGECGACSVLVDGRSVCSCLVPLCQVDGAELVTVEGLATDERLHPIQEAFLKHGAAQCGICTPGFLVMAAELLERGEAVSRADIRAGLSGNLCRCTGYQKIIDAVAEVVCGGD